MTLKVAPLVEAAQCTPDPQEKLGIDAIEFVTDSVMSSGLFEPEDYLISRRGSPERGTNVGTSDLDLLIISGLTGPNGESGAVDQDIEKRRLRWVSDNNIFGAVIANTFSDDEILVADKCIKVKGHLDFPRLDIVTAFLTDVEYLKPDTRETALTDGFDFWTMKDSIRIKTPFGFTQLSEEHGPAYGQYQVMTRLLKLARDEMHELQLITREEGIIDEAPSYMLECLAHAVALDRPEEPAEEVLQAAADRILSEHNLDEVIALTDGAPLFGKGTLQWRLDVAQDFFRKVVRAYDLNLS